MSHQKINHIFGGGSVQVQKPLKRRHVERKGTILPCLFVSVYNEAENLDKS